MRQKLIKIVFPIALDAILANVAAILAVWISRGNYTIWQQFRYYLPVLPFFTFISLVSFYIFELYDKEACRSRPRLLLNAFCSNLAVVIFFAALLLTFRPEDLSVQMLGLLFILLMSLIAGWRMTTWHLGIKRNGYDIARRLVISGANDGVGEILCNLGDPDGKNTETVQIEEGTDCDIPSLISLIEEEKTQRVLVQSGAMKHDSLIRLAQALADREVRLDVILDQYEMLIGAKISMQEMSLPTIQLFGRDGVGWYKNLKRVADIAISIIGLELLIPLYPVIAIAIKLTAPGPVLYKQERVGINGQTFHMLKFRSMYSDAETGIGPVWAEANDSRITPVGRFLRKTRLDELPQLFNVLWGNMSFIGPRPERPHFVSMFKDQIPSYVERLRVKPGITGWAQVHLNYDRNIEDVKLKTRYDLYYIENMSVLMDFTIILRTFRTVLLGKGAH